MFPSDLVIGVFAGFYLPESSACLATGLFVRSSFDVFICLPGGMYRGGATSKGHVFIPGAEKGGGI